MKSMKILILHRVFNDFSENPAAVNYQPGARQATSGPRERETKREPFAVAFGKKIKKNPKLRAEKNHIHNTSIDTRHISNNAKSPKKDRSLREN